jgi:hypothetical protein
MLLDSLRPGMHHGSCPLSRSRFIVAVDFVLYTSSYPLNRARQKPERLANVIISSNSTYITSRPVSAYSCSAQDPITRPAIPPPTFPTSSHNTILSYTPPTITTQPLPTLQVATTTYPPSLLFSSKNFPEPQCLISRARDYRRSIWTRTQV